MPWFTPQHRCYWVAERILLFSTNGREKVKIVTTSTLGLGRQEAQQIKQYLELMYLNVSPLQPGPLVGWISCLYANSQCKLVATYDIEQMSLWFIPIWWYGYTILVACHCDLPWKVRLTAEIKCCSLSFSWLAAHMRLLILCDLVVLAINITNLFTKSAMTCHIRTLSSSV